MGIDWVNDSNPNIVPGQCPKIATDPKLYITKYVPPQKCFTKIKRKQWIPFA